MVGLNVFILAACSIRFGLALWVAWSVKPEYRGYLEEPLQPSIPFRVGTAT